MESSGKQLYEGVATVADHWAKLGDRLGKAVDYNSVTAGLESRVLVSARRFTELRAAPADMQIASVEPIERVPRKLQVTELPSPAAVAAARQTSADAAESAG